ncbi:hypothetical protein PF005_g28321 [Phytophthora fragariae]|uniref:Uncharacterized protein n=1 Tax=Phytophthora fragariae TaxID=53985 RepID=A0A6A4BC54_9STRA|nr:hypothetical protein PF003_g7309 [Phytophthora fragariae]KAE8920685.1 hypothetical protein PF009_g29024 [Phytophthora fragariae]KAE8967609.1 hypothetical protein PF011_g27492 [Phytophthora fragariae]KAE9065398.1 hypothetical protein PF010_g28213 [Phytophthora fragariae]KAE9066471.1 hypothetical protein PF007_g28452 [Phytophthora fragariae]
MLRSKMHALLLLASSNHVFSPSSSSSSLYMFLKHDFFLVHVHVVPVPVVNDNN